MVGRFSLVWSHLAFGLVCTSLSSFEPSPYLLISVSAPLLPECSRHARDHHQSGRSEVSHHRQLHSIWALPLLQGKSVSLTSGRAATVHFIRGGLFLMLDVCYAGILSRVHQPAAVGLLLRPGRPGSVSHYEVRQRT